MAKRNSLIVEIANQQSLIHVDRRRMRSTVQTILADAKVKSAGISIAIVDDPAIHRLNRRYLSHDYPTDVLSFVLEDGREHLEGEIVVSAETAVRMSRRYGWSAESEMLLYVVHGALHLIGFDDKTKAGRRAMRKMERHHMDRISVEPARHRLDVSPSTPKRRKPMRRKPRSRRA